MEDQTIRPNPLPAREARATNEETSEGDGENTERTGQSKVCLASERKLNDFFPNGSTRNYTDADFHKMTDLLRLSQQERWSSVPRIYTVLRCIGQLQLIDYFISEGLSDIWFPFSPRNLPSWLSPSLKAQFIAIQPIVFTQALDLEKGEDGKHVTFAAGEQTWFESRGQLGRGAFGVVDKVVSLITLREYARKRMRRGKNFTKSRKEIQEFKGELALLKTINHRHCVRLVGSYTDPTYIGLIMEPVADCDLAAFLSAASENDDMKSRLRNYFGCLSGALQYLHERQIRHRDIKPANILVKGDCVYLADFGIALDWSELTRGTTTMDTAKSPIYCAPEVAKEEPRGSSSDIWSLGCVFVEMVTALKGRSVEDMRAYFKSKSEKYMFHCNIEPCQQWLMDLEHLSTRDNPPIVWSLNMVVYDRKKRYTADQLVEVIRHSSTHDASRIINESFCGDCCMSDDDLSYSSEGEDAWADSPAEDTVRIVAQTIASDLTVSFDSSRAALAGVESVVGSGPSQNSTERAHVQTPSPPEPAKLERIEKSDPDSSSKLQSSAHEQNLRPHQPASKVSTDINVFEPPADSLTRSDEYRFASKGDPYPEDDVDLDTMLSDDYRLPSKGDPYPEDDIDPNKMSHDDYRFPSKGDPYPEDDVDLDSILSDDYRLPSKEDPYAEDDIDFNRWGESLYFKKRDPLPTLPSSLAEGATVSEDSPADTPGSVSDLLGQIRGTGKPTIADETVVEIKSTRNQDTSNHANYRMKKPKPLTREKYLTADDTHVLDGSENEAIIAKSATKNLPESDAKSSKFLNDTYSTRKIVPRPGGVGKIESSGQIKIVLLGDNSKLKTNLLISFTTNHRRGEFIPMVFDDYSTEVKMGDAVYALRLFDTHGVEGEGHDRLRPLFYPDTDVFVICASIGFHKEYERAVGQWAPEIEHYCPSVPILLLGVKEYYDDGFTPKNSVKLGDELNYGRRVAKKIGAVKYLECDPMTRLRVNSVFGEAMLAARPPPPKAKKHRRWFGKPF